MPWASVQVGAHHFPLVPMTEAADSSLSVIYWLEREAVHIDLAAHMAAVQGPVRIADVEGATR